MKEDRSLTFLESLVVSVGTGAASGVACAVGNVDEQTQNIFTGMMIDVALGTAQNLKKRDREGYINPGW